MNPIKLDEINEIKACLPNSRTIFYYFKDRYALELLADAVQTPTPMRTLKQSPFAGLLRKPVVQEAVSTCANRLISPAPLQALWPTDPHAFVLSLGQWGHKKASDYYQTSRSGHNLVLHLKFSNQHDTAYRKALSTPTYSHFTCSSHPNDKRGRNTLAWARLDIDMQRGEALIEEVQNDWLREARADRKALTHIIKDNVAWEKASKKWPFYRECYAKVKSLKTLTEYLDDCIVPYERIWDEAILYPTIWFLRK